MNSGDVKERIKTFILAEFLPGESPDDLTDDVELVSTGILDSIATLRMAAFLEEHFQLSLSPHELGRDNMNTLRDLTALVTSKI